MSIYRAIIELEQLHKQHLYSDQKLFIENKLRQLKKCFKSPSPAYIYKIYEQLDFKIKNLPQGFYQLKLLKAKNAVFEVIKRQRILSANRKFNYKNATHVDEVLQEINNKGGKLILPIQQSKDSLCGNSQGECAGYITEWALCLINGKRPFGVIDPHNSPFKAANADVRRFFPNANHLAPLTERICRLQDLYGSRLWNGKIADQFSLRPVCKQNIYSLHFHKNTEEIASKLIYLTKQNTREVFHISLVGNSGHSLGFYKDDKKKYHFLDPNLGWFMFQSSTTFEKFLPYYFKELNYNHPYWSYMINSYSLEGTPHATLPHSFLSAGIRYKLNRLYGNYIVLVGKKIKEKINSFITMFFSRDEKESKKPYNFRPSFNKNVSSKSDFKLLHPNTLLHSQESYHNIAGNLAMPTTRSNRRRIYNPQQKDLFNSQSPRIQGVSSGIFEAKPHNPNVEDIDAIKLVPSRLLAI
ncbi:YopT-type cysteine protease domain-containing protein [Legionella sp. PC997]|uniref:YopT-type cysteine protease domain-containing protein n=1 Tax=Legionella sp. PC997 TaxID=2755562 RepID=UPI0015F996EE|nr:YopT-type cysteine protease domain-containing protein [Legionella sp. PC997]QMT61677.1 hypothetical protein HBNCFIEN_03081 [Legionella sp. PC997]